MMKSLTLRGRRSPMAGMYALIEHMPFARSEHAGKDLVSTQKSYSIIRQQFGELQPHRPSAGNGPATYYKLANANGTLGFIGAVTECSVRSVTVSA